jgi:hypothetical protein
LILVFGFSLRCDSNRIIKNPSEHPDRLSLEFAGAAGFRISEFSPSNIGMQKEIMAYFRAGNCAP